MNYIIIENNWNIYDSNPKFETYLIYKIEFAVLQNFASVEKGNHLAQICYENDNYVVRLTINQPLVGSFLIFKT